MPAPPRPKWPPEYDDSETQRPLGLTCGNMAGFIGEVHRHTPAEARLRVRLLQKGPVNLRRLHAGDDWFLARLIPDQPRIDKQTGKEVPSPPDLLLSMTPDELAGLGIPDAWLPHGAYFTPSAFTGPFCDDPSACSTGVVFVDIDVDTDAGETRPTLAQLHGMIREAGLPDASVVVSSGTGWHVYFLLDGPLDDMDLYRRIQVGLATRLPGGDTSAQNPARLMRIPGSPNHKKGGPYETGVVFADYDRRYSIDEFTDLAADPSDIAPSRTKSRSVSPLDDIANIGTTDSTPDVVGVVDEGCVLCEVDVVGGVSVVQCRERAIDDEVMERVKRCFRRRPLNRSGVIHKAVFRLTCEIKPLVPSDSIPKSVLAEFQHWYERGRQHTSKSKTEVMGQVFDAWKNTVVGDDAPAGLAEATARARSWADTPPDELFAEFGDDVTNNDGVLACLFVELAETDTEKSPTGHVWLAQEAASKELGENRKTTRLRIKAFEAAGLVEVLEQGKTGMATTYRVHMTRPKGVGDDK